MKRRLVFIEDYDINVARWMVEGVDVWLNTPRRPLEACGTSGMKAAFNGAINFSMLDGWWDEAYEPDVGWAIGHGEMYADTSYQDVVESNALYDLLEKEIIPSFYDRDRYGRPRSWLSRMKNSMLKLCPTFSIDRMLREYALRMYLPSDDRYQEFLTNTEEKARMLSAWKRKVEHAWNNVFIEKVESTGEESVKVGDDMRVRAWVRLAGLVPDEVSVQIYHGPIDKNGNINEGEVRSMAPSGDAEGDVYLFSGAIRYFRSGRHGFSVRILPHHDDLASPFECGLVHWASEPIAVTA